jgi:hypothetical protein
MVVRQMKRQDGILRLSGLRQSVIACGFLLQWPCKLNSVPEFFRETKQDIACQM